MGEIFGEYLKSLRIDRKLTLRQLEEQTQISNGYLSQVERGERNPPTMKILVKLAKALGVPLSALSDKAEDELRRNREQEKESKKEPEAKEEMPNPDTEFICRGYENLSEEKKRTLKDFLQYLQKDNKGKK